MKIDRNSLHLARTASRHGDRTEEDVLHQLHRETRQQIQCSVPLCAHEKSSLVRRSVGEHDEPYAGGQVRSPTMPFRDSDPIYCYFRLCRRDLTSYLLVSSIFGTSLYIYSRPHLRELQLRERASYRCVTSGRREQSTLD